MKYEEVYKYTGNFGWFQGCLLSMAVMLFMFDSEMVTMVFVGGSMEHWCRVEELANLSFDTQKLLAVPPLYRTPRGINKNEDFNDSISSRAGEYHSCLRYQRNYSGVLQSNWSSPEIDKIPSYNVSDASVDTVSCESYVYSQSSYISAIVSEFKLVCGMEFLVPLVSSLYMLGGLIGSVSAGCISDAIGRKKTLLANMALRVFSISIFLFAPSIYAVLVGRLLLGVAGNAVRVTHFVLVVEMIGPKYRTHVSTALNSGISCGAIAMSIMASYIHNHFHYQLAVFASILPLFVYIIWLIPESPRWLHVHGKHEAVDRIWLDICQINGASLPGDMRSEKLDNLKPSRQSRLKDLFFSNILLIRIVIPGYLMLVGSLIYYAIMLNMSLLAGNIYVNSCISSAVEIPGYTLGLYLCNNKYMCFAGILQAVCIPLRLNGFLAANAAVMLLSRAFVCSALSVMTIYSMELMPTQVRNTGFGFMITCARIGSMVAPYMGKFLVKVWTPLPSAIFGTMSITSGLLCLLLPETYGQPSLDTIDELRAQEKQPV